MACYIVVLIIFSYGRKLLCVSSESYKVDYLLVWWDIPNKKRLFTKLLTTNQVKPNIRTMAEVTLWRIVIFYMKRISENARRIEDFNPDKANSTNYRTTKFMVYETCT